MAKTNRAKAGTERQQMCRLALIQRDTHSEGAKEKLVSNYTGASQVALVVKNPPANAGDVRDTGSIPGLGRSPGGGHGNPLQSSCLKDPKDRGAWQAAVHGSHRVGHN